MRILGSEKRRKGANYMQYLIYGAHCLLIYLVFTFVKESSGGWGRARVEVRGEKLYKIPNNFNIFLLLIKYSNCDNVSIEGRGGKQSTKHSICSFQYNKQSLIKKQTCHLVSNNAINILYINSQEITYKGKISITTQYTYGK